MPNATKFKSQQQRASKDKQQMGMLLESKHASEDDLELYFLNLLCDSHLDRIEQHLLVCTLCIEAAEQLSDDISLMRLALRRYAASERPRAHAKWERFPARAFALQ
jgi:hypothetical protein